MTLKEFEKKQLDWWCNHYRTTLKDFSMRTRQFLNGEIDQGMLDTFLLQIEKQNKERETLA